MFASLQYSIEVISLERNVAMVSNPYRLTKIPEMRSCLLLISILLSALKYKKLYEILQGKFKTSIMIHRQHETIGNK